MQAAITAAALLPAMTFASGYKLNEQSAAGMGTAHAGRAAMAEDASVVFYNPAAMNELDAPVLTAGFTYINGVGEFTGNATDVSGALPITGADGDDAYSNGGNYLGESFIPFFYYANPITEKFAVGLGVFVPFGTNTDYDDDFVGGAFADETSLASISIAPTFSYKVNDQINIGGGIDIVYMEGTLSKHVDTIPGTHLLDEGFENHFEVSGDDWGYGWNLGAYYKLSEATTLGFAYRSEIEFTLEGDSEFAEDFTFYDPTHPLADGTTGLVQLGTVRPQASKVPLTTPQSATLSATHQLTDQVLLQAGATWTGWSSFKYFDVIATENLADLTPDVSDIAANNGLGNGYIGHIVENWKDVWAIALGGTYQLNDKLALRAGYAYDQSPVTDEYRTARVPSSDRQWLTFGAGYKIDNNLSLDVAAGYLFMYPMDLKETNKDLNDETIVNDTTGQPVKVTGEYEIDVFGLSAQVNYKF